MKLKSLSRVLAVVLCLMLLVSCIPLQASAETTAETVSMVEGEVIKDFAAADTNCVSSDSSIAWVDKDGSLNALKPGTVTITVPNGDNQTEYTVTVNDYTDGSAVAGNLKILVRYNDSMQFYDGHVYLLFTSYQDGVTISVPDLYGAYNISDKYYKDINEDIANGSNHTGKDTDRYFTFSDSTKSVTLNRGEIVTIGMYRDFDLSVPQAALGSIKNSSAWTTLVRTGKAAVIETIFKFLDDFTISTDEAVAKIKAVFEEVGLDYNKALDGVVDGGVCFNRELYNQKLEWDQYENVTYDLDITRNQLNIMQMYLGGNLNKFSILKNSCATVALRAWNAAVGTRNGEDSAYKLTSAGEGIFSIIDAPKGVRDSIRDRLPGYYLNNAEGVAEPGAGYQDDTGYVYVSAPKKIAPVNYEYPNFDSDGIEIDESRTNIANIINAAKGDTEINYDKDSQKIDVTFDTATAEVYPEETTISKINFSINGETVTADSQTVFDNGIWFKVKITDPIQYENFCVTEGGSDKIRPYYTEDGYVSFYASTLPVDFRIVGGETSKNILNTVIVNGDDLSASTTTEVYYKDGDKTVALDASAEVPAGTKLFVKSTIGINEYDYILTDITLNGNSIFNEKSFDAEENAYFATMPSQYSTLTIKYEKAILTSTNKTIVQIGVGDTINASDYAELTVNGNPAPDRVVWQTLSNKDVIKVEGDKLTALKEGEAIVYACSETNNNIFVLYEVQVYENAEDMVKITFDEATNNVNLSYNDGDNTKLIPYSGYLVKKGTDVNLTYAPKNGMTVLFTLINKTYVDFCTSVKVEQDTDIKVVYANAQISGMPKEIKLDSKNSAYQLNAQTKYTLLPGITPYDESIKYVSSDSLVNVDENGLITVSGEIPADGKMVIVTAYAGSSGDSVSASAKVILGDYKGSRIVGKVTLSSRRITKEEFMSHGCLTFTTYEDVDLDTSYYDYYQPDDRYNAFMVDYLKNPEKYNSDPALCNDNELGLENRESYFITHSNGAKSAPETISLVAGESITVSNYGFDPTNIIAIKKALEGSLYNNSKDTQELVKQMNLYINASDEFDGEQAFDSLIETLKQMFAVSSITGSNPADGQSDGGMTVNREIYNQFRRNDGQLPNNYYEVEITADELEMMKSYLANPDNNYYSLFNKNCAAGVVDMWNTTLADRPELKVKGNYTIIAVEPMSLYFELKLLGQKQGLDGKSGTDFVPHTVRFTDEIIDTINKIKEIGEVELTDESKAKIDAAREAYDKLGDKEKERVWNNNTLTDAEKTYETLKKASEDEQLAKDIEEFNKYKAEQITAASNLSKPDDPFECGIITALAQILIAQTDYNPEQSLEENKAAVDEIMDWLSKELDEIRNPEPAPQPEPVLIGDVNNDGVIDILDAAMIQKFTVESVELTPEQLNVADVNDDGAVDILDVVDIQKFTVDKISEFKKKA